MRRGPDIAIALLALVVTAPLLLVAALAVLADLGRPVLFVQARSGLGGTAFRMVKLRTMTNARDAQGRLLPDAARVTRLGRLLRRSRIDELPGLVHLLTGEMSLIGPRPLLPATVAAMGEAGEQRGRVLPGLTGWAQVNGNALLSQGQKLAHDLWYIDNRSLGLDLLILVRTVRVVIFGERLGDPAGRAYAGRRRRSR